MSYLLSAASFMIFFILYFHVSIVICTQCLCTCTFSLFYHSLSHFLTILNLCIQVYNILFYWPHVWSRLYVFRGVGVSLCWLPVLFSLLYSYCFLILYIYHTQTSFISLFIYYLVLTFICIVAVIIIYYSRFI